MTPIGNRGYPEPMKSVTGRSGLISPAFFTNLTFSNHTVEDTEGTAGIPDVLLTGDHAAIRRWRRQQSLGRTWLRRPDLLARVQLDKHDRALLNAFRADWLAGSAEEIGFIRPIP